MHEMYTYIDTNNLRRLKVDSFDISDNFNYMSEQDKKIKKWFNENHNVDIIKVGYYGRYDNTGVEYVMENTEETKIAVMTFKLEFK